MGADLAVGSVGFGAGSHQNAGVAGGRIVEDPDASDRDLAQPRHRANRVHRILVKPRADGQPDISGEHPQAGQGEKLG
jgi:hypothetical protein